MKKKYLINTVHNPTDEDFDLLYGGVFLEMKTSYHVHTRVPAGVDIFENKGNFVGDLPEGTEPVAEEDRYILSIFAFDLPYSVVRVCDKSDLRRECLTIHP